MGSVILGVVGLGALGLGVKGFTKHGLPFSENKRITGTSAKVVGSICVALGLALIVMAFWAMITSHGQA
jgi:hypothetical protein